MGSCVNAMRTGQMHRSARSTPGRPMRAARTGSASAAGSLSCLRLLLQQHGGHVHAALELAERAPCGARGVVASVPISAVELELQPLISLPVALYLDNK